MIRTLCSIALLACGCAVPHTALALAPEDIRHLAQRAGFAATPEEARRLAALDRTQAVDDYLSRADAADPLDAEPLPEWMERRRLSTPPPGMVMEQAGYKRTRYAHRVALEDWWLDRMVRSGAPLRERMALFWHMYFPVLAPEVSDEGELARQLLRFRSNWAGDYRQALHAITRDPATEELLSLVHNQQGHPNENFARELLELYTLGPGHYSEGDVREAARAFTGWRTIRRTGWFVLWWPDHDFGRKQFLGQTGRWDGDDIVEIVLRQPRAAEYFVERLWQEFVSPTPDPGQVRLLAAQFRRDYQVRPLLRALLLSDAFWAPQNRGSLVKSPVDLVVGTLRSGAAAGAPGNAAAAWTTAMGQGLFHPPDVKGWRGNLSWINAQSLQDRQMFLRGLDGGFDEDDISSLLLQIPEYPGFEGQKLLADSQLLHQGIAAAKLPLAELARDPHYQLK